MLPKSALWQIASGNKLRNCIETAICLSGAIPHMSDATRYASDRLLAIGVHMSKIHPLSETDDSARLGTQSRFKRRLLAGVATAALLAVGPAYTLRAYSADTHLASSPFGASSAARVPATQLAIPGFADLVTAVKPAVVSVRVKADTAAQEASDDNEGAF